MCLNKILKFDFIPYFVISCTCLNQDFQNLRIFRIKTNNIKESPKFYVESWLENPGNPKIR